MRCEAAIRVKFTACLLLVLVLPALVWAETPGQLHAQKLIDEHKTVIARFMHPALALDKVVCMTIKSSETGDFYMVYMFSFGGEKYHSSLRFRFFEDGSLDTIEVVGTSSWIKPFQAFDLIITAALQVVPAPVAHRLSGLQGEGTTKTMLEFWLRAQASGGRQPPD